MELCLKMRKSEEEGVGRFEGRGEKRKCRYTTLRPFISYREMARAPPISASWWQ